METIVAESNVAGSLSVVRFLRSRLLRGPLLWSPFLRSLLLSSPLLRGVLLEGPLYRVYCYGANYAMSIVARSIGEKSIVAEVLCGGLECC